MATYFQRHPERRVVNPKGGAKRSNRTSETGSRNQDITELFYSSKINISYTPRSFLRISLRGPIAKLPSAANERMVWINKRPLLKLLEQLENAAGPATIKLILNQVKGYISKMQPIMGKEPKFENKMTVLKRLWLENTPPNFVPFPSDIDHRLFVLILVSRDMRLSDTHNCVKATCDYLQEAGIFKNDLHVDAIALRASDFVPDLDDCTSIIVVPQHGAQTSVAHSLGLLLSGLFRSGPQEDAFLRSQQSQNKQTSIFQNGA